jgi:hypothetical protein
MTSTDEITDPTWHDIFDRDKMIVQLQREILLLQQEVQREREARQAALVVVSELRARAGRDAP